MDSRAPIRILGVGLALAAGLVLTGPADPSGAPTSVPDELLVLLLRARFFKVEVLLRGARDWASNAMLFTDWFSAASFVIDMGLRWPQVVATRISATEPTPWARDPATPGR